MVTSYWLNVLLRTTIISCQSLVNRRLTIIGNFYLPLTPYFLPLISYFLPFTFNHRILYPFGYLFRGYLFWGTEYKVQVTEYVSFRVSFQGVSFQGTKDEVQGTKLIFSVYVSFVFWGMGEKVKGTRKTVINHSYAWRRGFFFRVNK